MINIRDHYSALVESSDDAIISTDMDGTVRSWNAAAERLYGFEADEIIGEDVRKLIPPHMQDEEDRILERVRAGEKVGQFFTKRMHRSGKVLDVSVTVSPIRDPEGVIRGASKIARDAAPFLANQRRLLESEERFRLLAENIAQFAWIARADGDITWYNKRWYDYTGTSPDEVEGWGWRAVHHPEHVGRVELGFRESLRAGTEWEDTFPLRGRDGQYRWFLSRARPIRNDAGEIECWFGTNTDITEQREQAEQIRLLLMEVNHRAKNMLSTVQALARRTARDGEGFLARFEDRVRSLAVNQDILVRRDWREVPVDELVTKQLRFVEDAAGEVSHTGPDCSLKPRAAEVLGMALHELATNSLKYGALSAVGGHVEICWSCTPSDTPDGKFAIFWHETNGPEVVPPERTGFGTTLIRDVPIHNLGAEVTLEYRPDGVYWSLEGDSESLCCRLPALA